jgi:hypothetical protein
VKFANGTEYIVGPLLSKTAASMDEAEQFRIRFRSDIITPLTDEASVALSELNEILARIGPQNDISEAIDGQQREEMCLNLTADMLPSGSIILLDNGRWLHARNEVKDPSRHLRRIRWGARKFKLV